MAHEFERPAESGDEHAALVMSLGNERDNLAGVAVLRILWPKGAMFAVFNHQAYEFHQVSDVEHAALVFDFRECGQFAGKLAEQWVVTLAPLAEYHGRAKNHHLEGVAVQRADAVFSQNLAVAVTICRVYWGVARDEFWFTDGGAVAVHDGAAHEYELFNASVLRFLGAFHCEVGIYSVVEFRTFFADFTVIAMGDSCHVVNRVVLAKIKATPGVTNHVECINLVLARKFRLCEVIGKGGADVAVRACNEDVDHWRASCSCLWISPVPPSTTPSLLSTLINVPKKHLQSNKKLWRFTYSPSSAAFTGISSSSRPLI